MLRACHWLLRRVLPDGRLWRAWCLYRTRREQLAAASLSDVRTLFEQMRLNFEQADATRKALREDIERARLPAPPAAPRSPLDRAVAHGHAIEGSYQVVNGMGKVVLEVPAPRSAPPANPSQRSRR